MVVESYNAYEIAEGINDYSLARIDNSVENPTRNILKIGRIEVNTIEVTK